MELNESLVFTPNASLVFDLSSKHATQTNLQIMNNSNQCVVYKIKTTTPERYIVKPNHGLIHESSETKITIVVVQNSKKKDDKSFARVDKFLVQAIAIDQATVTEMNEKQELADAISQIFQRTEKKLIFAKKLLVDYISGDGPTNERAATSNDEFSPTKKLGERSGSKQQLGQALSGPMPGTPESMFAEIIAIRKKYDDLVAFTVSLTAERDALASELAALKKNRNRDAQDNEIKHDSPSEIPLTHSSSKNQMQQSTSQSFRHALQQIFPFLLIALIAFYIGRIIQVNQQGGTFSFL